MSFVVFVAAMFDGLECHETYLIDGLPVQHALVETLCDVLTNLLVSWYKFRLPVSACCTCGATICWLLFSYSLGSDWFKFLWLQLVGSLVAKL